jgi:hypothetical protein
MGPQRNTWIASSIPTFRSPLNLNSAPSSPGYRRSAVQVCITSQGRGRRACTARPYSIQRPFPARAGQVVPHVRLNIILRHA